MESHSRFHPRRRPDKPTGPALASIDTGLRKSPTFHSPSSVSSDDLCDPFTASMPKRSSTNVDSLEALVNPERRVADIIASFDRTYSGKTSPDASILRDLEVLAVPGFVVRHAAIDAEPMGVQPKPMVRAEHQHQSDSGLGTSLSGSKLGSPKARDTTSHASAHSSMTASRSAVTKSYSSMDAAETGTVHALSDHAKSEIRERIVLPILAEPALKDFHRLVEDVPARIGRKEISNLRDLEKTLIFLAPVLSATPTSYVIFCETSIRHIRSTVDHISDLDQRLPNDRPYSNNYFIDLLEQVRRYAAIMRATRDKEAAGQPLGEDDYHRDERIVIRGGISHDGTPAELVRERNDGKVIPLANRDEVPAVQFKRPLSDEEDFDDGGVRRSMARRRKSDKPSDVMHTCRECKKEFKRPCDLTKHEKTHSRPWKCPQPKCRYHELGWPTEKERDRHINDKHSSAPPQYKCQYPPCTYSSKRESNCKQHMEKSHGFNYVRSKSNGRTKKTTSSAGETPATATPLTPFMATPPSALQNMPTPVSPFTTSPQLQNFNTFDPPPAPVYGLTPAMSTMGDVSGDNRRESVATSGSSMSYSTNQSPAELNTFAPTFTPEEPTLDAGSSMFNGFMQPQTPGLNTANNGYQLNSNFNNAFSQSPSMPLSAEAQNMTLFTPQADDDTLQIDESFAGHFPPVGDFTLFDSSDPSSDLGGNQDWYNSLGNTNSMDGQFDSLFNQGGNQFSEFF